MIFLLETPLGFPIGYVSKNKSFYLVDETSRTSVAEDFSPRFPHYHANSDVVLHLDVHWSLLGNRHNDHFKILRQEIRLCVHSATTCSPERTIISFENESSSIVSQ